MKKINKIAITTFATTVISLSLLSLFTTTAAAEDVDPELEALISTETAVVTTYNRDSQTILPDYEIDPNANSIEKVYDGEKDKEYSEKTKTTITIATWDEWVWDEVKKEFYLVHKTSAPAESYKGNGIDPSEYDVSLIFTPQNVNGLKDTTETGYKTRSGYGFSVESFFNVQNVTNSARYTLDNGSIIPNLRAALLFPEFNYSKENGKFTDMTVSETPAENYTEQDDRIWTYALSLTPSLQLDKDSDKYADASKPYHYTPMWYKDGLYTPVLEIGGLWTPVGEVKYTIKQTAIDEKRYAKIKTNDYLIEGSLFDDMYTTHDKYVKSEN